MLLIIGVSFQVCYEILIFIYIRGKTIFLYFNRELQCSRMMFLTCEIHEIKYRRTCSFSEINEINLQELLQFLFCYIYMFK